MDTVLSRSLGGLVLTGQRHAAHAHMAQHQHAAPYICIVLDGAYQESSGARTLSLVGGAVLGHPPGERHENTFSRLGGRCLNIEADGNWQDNPMWMDCLHARRNSRFAATPGALARLRRELALTDSVRPLGLAAALFDLLDSAQTSPADADAPAWLRRVRDRLHATPLHGHGLAELALEAGVHPSHLARAFRRWQGRSIGDYVRRLRVDAALAMLAAGGASLSEIALEHGFADQAHFSRVVKRLTGSTPRAYKNARQVQEPGGGPG